MSTPLLLTSAFNTPVIVNLDQVQTIMPFGEHAMIVFAGPTGAQERVSVKASVQQIWEQIKLRTE